MLNNSFKMFMLSNSMDSFGKLSTTDFCSLNCYLNCYFPSELNCIQFLSATDNQYSPK